MEEFHRDALLVNDDTEGTFLDVVKGHTGKRIGLFLNDRGRCGNLLKIVPKGARFDAHGNRGEATHRNVQSRFEGRQIDLLAKRCRETEDVAPIARARGGIDLSRVVERHPPKLLLMRHVPLDKFADPIKILLPILQAVQHVAVPQSGSDHQLAGAAGRQQPTVHGNRVVEHDLVSARKNERRRHFFEHSKQGRNVRIALASPVVLLAWIGVGIKIFLLASCSVEVAIGKIAQTLTRHGGIALLVLLIRGAGRGQVGPRGDGENASREGSSLFGKLEAERIAKSTARALTAKQYLLGGVAVGDQISVGVERIVQGRRIRALGGEAVGGAKHTDATFYGKRAAKALGIVQATGGIASTVQIQDHAALHLVLGVDHRAGDAPHRKVLKGHFIFIRIGHQLSKCILSLSDGCQRATGKERLA